jgi:hypothetical protein
MTRKITPRQDYDAEPRYPSLIEVDLDRRDFLRGALSGSAAVGILMVTGSGALAGGRRAKTYRTTVRLSGRYTFRHGNYQLQRVVVQSPSAQLIRFLGDKKEQPGIEKAVRRVCSAHSCVDLLQGKLLARLQRRVAKALATRFRSRQKTRVATPTVTLYVGVAGAVCLGDCPAPVPFCRPPKKKRPPKRPRPRK